MSLYTGKNEIKVEVIDSETGDVAARFQWFGLSYEVTVAVEEKIATAFVSLGKEGVQLLKKS